MSNGNTLVKKLAKIMGEIGSVQKTGRNDFHKYDYVEEHVLVNSVRGKLAEAGIFIFPSVEEHTQNGSLATVLMKFTIVDGETGESFETLIAGQGDDKGDKAYYKAYTGAVKYFIMKTFLIPTGDDPEADIETDKRASKRANSRQSTPNPKPVTKDQLLEKGARIGLSPDEVEALIMAANGDLDYCYDAFGKRDVKQLQAVAKKAMAS